MRCLEFVEHAQLRAGAVVIGVEACRRLDIYCADIDMIISKTKRWFFFFSLLLPNRFESRMKTDTNVRLWSW
jgi:hypothetical protein